MYDICSMLTKKQKNLLLYINKKIRSTGVSPSYEEMKNSLNLKSKSGIHNFLIGESLLKSQDIGSKLKQFTQISL